MFGSTLYFEADTNINPNICIRFEYKSSNTNLSYRVELMYWNVLEYNRIPILANLLTQQWKMIVGGRFDGN